jgi:adenylate cyclase
MTSSLPALRRERLQVLLRVVAISALIGAAYGVVSSPPGASPWVSIVIGLLNGAGIAASIGSIEVFVLREGSSFKRLVRLPFVLVVLLKTLLYGAVASAFIVGLPRLAAALPGMGGTTSFGRSGTLIAIGFSLAMTLIFVVVLQAAGLLGRRTFRNLVLGRYRKPRAERRYFLFVDIVGSTPIAERLGPLQAHRFLAAVYSATAEPVAACEGEIYQYVGDEIVITWTEPEGRPGERPLRCFFLMEAALREAAGGFRSQFGAEPRLRAALHLGEVIAGEIGEQRRAIVYHGDVMNTAARLEQATRDLDCRFIASDAAAGALGRPADLDWRDLGELALRGRREPIRAWAVGEGGAA